MKTYTVKVSSDDPRDAQHEPRIFSNKRTAQMYARCYSCGWKVEFLETSHVSNDPNVIIGRKTGDELGEIGIW